MAAPPQVVDATPIRHPQVGQYYFVRGLELWHLLSLDAPTVAVLWTWFIARTSHINLPGTAILAMGTAVWMLYAADRLLDTRALSLTFVPDSLVADLEARHYFHRRHQRVFRTGILCASLLLASLLPQLAPQSVHLYLILGTLLFGYFILIHVNIPPIQATHNSGMPKEVAVGVFFSAAAFIPTVAADASLRPALLPGAILFAGLCSLNCLFIYFWEHQPTSARASSPASKALSLPTSLALTGMVADLLLVALDNSLPWPIPVACAIATALLLLLHRLRQRLSPTTLRAAADLCLLTPLLLLRSL